MTSRTATTDRTDAAFDLLDRCDGDLGRAVFALLDVAGHSTDVIPLDRFTVDFYGDLDPSGHITARLAPSGITRFGHTDSDLTSPLLALAQAITAEL